jgi:hypothetical protein
LAFLFADPQKDKAGITLPALGIPGDVWKSPEGCLALAGDVDDTVRMFYSRSESQKSRPLTESFRSGLSAEEEYLMTSMKLHDVVGAIERQRNRVPSDPLELVAELLFIAEAMVENLQNLRMATENPLDHPVRYAYWLEKANRGADLFYLTEDSFPRWSQGPIDDPTLAAGSLPYRFLAGVGAPDFESGTGLVPTEAIAGFMEASKDSIPPYVAVLYLIAYRDVLNQHDEERECSAYAYTSEEWQAQRRNFPELAKRNTGEMMNHLCLIGFGVDIATFPRCPRMDIIQTLSGRYMIDLRDDVWKRDVQLAVAMCYADQLTQLAAHGQQITAAANVDVPKDAKGNPLQDPELIDVRAAKRAKIRQGHSRATPRQIRNFLAIMTSGEYVSTASAFTIGETCANAAAATSQFIYVAPDETSGNTLLIGVLMLLLTTLMLVGMLCIGFCLGRRQNVSPPRANGTTASCAPPASTPSSSAYASPPDDVRSPLWPYDTELSSDEEVEGVLLRGRDPVVIDPTEIPRQRPPTFEPRTKPHPETRTPAPAFLVSPGQGLPAPTRDEGTQASLPGSFADLHAEETLNDYALLPPIVWITQPSLDRRGTVFHTRSSCFHIRNSVMVPFRSCLDCEDERMIRGWVSTYRDMQPPAGLQYSYGGPSDYSHLPTAD